MQPVPPGAGRGDPALAFFPGRRRIAIPLFNNVQQRARIAKANADVRSMASAVSMYAAHMGAIPSDIGMVTASSQNAQGQTSGAFLAAVPAPPNGWSTYAYSINSVDGSFTISASGDGTSARVP